MPSWVENLNSSIANVVQGANANVRSMQDDFGKWREERQGNRAAAEEVVWNPALIRPPGLTTFEVVWGRNMPNMDGNLGRTLGLKKAIKDDVSDCYALVSLVDAAGERIAKTQQVRTSTVRDSLDPDWHAFVAFGVLPLDSDALQVEIFDDDFLKADDFIGAAGAPSLTFENLKHAGVPVDAEVSLQTTKPRVHASEPTSVRVRFVAHHLPLVVSPAVLPPAAPPAPTADLLDTSVAAIDLGADKQPRPLSSSSSSGPLGTDNEGGGNDEDGLPTGYVAPSAEDILRSGNSANKDMKTVSKEDEGNNDVSSNNDPFGMIKELPEAPKKEEEEPEADVGPPVRKTLFVLRHGESKWNDAQASRDVKGMLKQFDHELNFKGIAQAAEFNRKWKEAAAAAAAGESAASTVAVQEVAKEENAENSDEKRSAQTKAERCAAFLSAGIIFASPLTRAVETALVGCEGHPYFQTPGAALHLMRSAREVKSTPLGSLDTIGHHGGDLIAPHVRECLTRDGGLEAGHLQEVLNPPLLPRDATGTWWTSLEAMDSEAQVQQRMRDFFMTLRHGADAEVIIVVGHSLFFRELVKHHLSPTFKLEQPEFTADLAKKKLGNAACLALDLEWPAVGSATANNDPMAPPLIVGADLMFGSGFHVHEKAHAPAAAAAVANDGSGGGGGDSPTRYPAETEF